MLVDDEELSKDVLDWVCMQFILTKIHSQIKLSYISIS